MSNKTNVFLILAVSLCSVFFMARLAQAGSCGEISGQECKTDKCDSYDMDVATPTSAFICDGTLQCCVPKGMVIKDPCANQVNDSACTLEDKFGACNNGVCKIDEEASAKMAKNSRKFFAYAGPRSLFLGLFKISGLLSLISFVVFSVQYYFLSTDEQKLLLAKIRMRKSIIGIIVALAGLIITYAIIGMLSA